MDQSICLITQGSLSSSEEKRLRQNHKVVIWNSEYHKNKSPAEVGVWDVLVVNIAKPSFTRHNAGYTYLESYYQDLKDANIPIVYLYRSSKLLGKVNSAMIDYVVKKMPAEVATTADLMLLTPDQVSKRADNMSISILVDEPSVFGSPTAANRDTNPLDDDIVEEGDDTVDATLPDATLPDATDATTTDATTTDATTTDATTTDATTTDTTAIDATTTDATATDATAADAIPSPQPPSAFSSVFAALAGPSVDTEDDATDDAVEPQVDVNALLSQVNQLTQQVQQLQYEKLQWVLERQQHDFTHTDLRTQIRSLQLRVSESVRKALRSPPSITVDQQSSDDDMDTVLSPTDSYSNNIVQLNSLSTLIKSPTRAASVPTELAPALPDGMTLIIDMVPSQNDVSVSYVCPRQLLPVLKRFLFTDPASRVNAFKRAAHYKASLEREFAHLLGKK